MVLLPALTSTTIVTSLDYLQPTPTAVPPVSTPHVVRRHSSVAVAAIAAAAGAATLLLLCLVCICLRRRARIKADQQTAPESFAPSLPPLSARTPLSASNQLDAANSIAKHSFYAHSNASFSAPPRSDSQDRAWGLGRWRRGGASRFAASDARRVDTRTRSADSRCGERDDMSFAARSAYRGRAGTVYAAHSDDGISPRAYDQRSRFGLSRAATMYSIDDGSVAQQSYWA